MTAATVKSTLLGNLATPANMAENSLPFQKNGHETTQIDSISVATTSIDDVGDIMLLLAVPSNAQLTSLKLFNDDLDASTGLTFDIGVANGPEKFVDGSTTYKAFDPISAQLFTAALADQSAITTGTEIVIAHATSHVDEMNDSLWHRAGLAQDPQRLLSIQVKVAAAATTPTAGRLVLVAKYLAA